MAKRPYRGKPAAPPRLDTAEAGAALIRAYALKLFDRQDGNGANWRMMADSLFKAAFEALDRLPDDACRKVAARVHIGAYERVVDGPKVDSAASNSRPTRAENLPLNTADLKSNEPASAKGPFSAS